MFESVTDMETLEKEFRARHKEITEAYYKNKELTKEEFEELHRQIHEGYEKRRFTIVLESRRDEVLKRIKDAIDRITDEYIRRKIAELNEDLTDITSELCLYLVKPKLTEYEVQRKQFIEKVIAWKEEVWRIEGQIEDEVDSVSNDELYDFTKNLIDIEQRYEKELADMWNNVVSLQVLQYLS